MGSRWGYQDLGICPGTGLLLPVAGRIRHDWYGNLKKDVDVVTNAKNVAFFDTCAALLAGVVVIPAVFAFRTGRCQRSSADVYFSSGSVPADAIWRGVCRNLLRSGAFCGADFADEPVRDAYRSIAAAIQTVPEGGGGHCRGGIRGSGESSLRAGTL